MAPGRGSCLLWVTVAFPHGSTSPLNVSRRVTPPFPFAAMNLRPCGAATSGRPGVRASKGDSQSRSHVSPDGSGGLGGDCPPGARF
jgi:hypothetical protein